MSVPARWLLPALLGLALLGVLVEPAAAVERFTRPQLDSYPQTRVPDGQPAWRTALDLSMFISALGVGVWLAFYRRSRRGLFFLTLFVIAYFGFYREGCVCTVGSIQNVAHSAGAGAVLPWLIAIFFALPLILSLFYGRVFCAGVCPLGAIQDAVLVKPVQVPRWLETGLGLFAHAYLALAVMFAVLGSEFIICKYDPFVGFFRLDGKAYMLLIGGVLLALSMFVGRVYCRFICPYSILLRIFAPLSRRQVSISPKECVDCRLCETSCPFGAIRQPTPAGKMVPSEADRRRLRYSLAGAVAIVAGFAALGWALGPVLAGEDFLVNQARLVDRHDRIDAALKYREQDRPVPDDLRQWLVAQGAWQMVESGEVELPQEVEAFRKQKESTQSLLDRAAQRQQAFRIGTVLVGLWVGGAMALRLVSGAIWRRRVGYTADPAACVACARCYMSCPVELERRGIVLTVSAQSGQQPNSGKPAEALVGA